MESTQSINERPTVGQSVLLRSGPLRLRTTILARVEQLVLRVLQGIDRVTLQYFKAVWCYRVICFAE
ncbi:MAG: hypothetical protein AAF709_10495, partial [Pseudomonadota bacterium]